MAQMELLLLTYGSSMPVVHGTRTTRKIKPLSKGNNEKRLALSREITIEQQAWRGCGKI